MNLWNHYLSTINLQHLPRKNVLSADETNTLEKYFELIIYRNWLFYKHDGWAPINIFQWFLKLGEPQEPWDVSQLYFLTVLPAEWLGFITTSLLKCSLEVISITIPMLDMSSKSEIEYTKTFQHCTQNGMVKYYIYRYDMSYWNRTTLSFACVLGSSVLTHKHQAAVLFLNLARQVSHVINYDLPHNIDSYVHRIGRRLGIFVIREGRFPPFHRWSPTWNHRIFKAGTTDPLSSASVLTEKTMIIVTMFGLCFQRESHFATASKDSQIWWDNSHGKPWGKDARFRLRGLNFWLPGNGVPATSRRFHELSMAEPPPPDVEMEALPGYSRLPCNQCPGHAIHDTQQLMLKNVV